MWRVLTARRAGTSSTYRDRQRIGGHAAVGSYQHVCLLHVFTSEKKVQQTIESLHVGAVLRTNDAFFEGDDVTLRYHAAGAGALLAGILTLNITDNEPTKPASQSASRTTYGVLAVFHFVYRRAQQLLSLQNDAFFGGY